MRRVSVHVRVRDVYMRRVRVSEMRRVTTRLFEGGASVRN